MNRHPYDIFPVGDSFPYLHRPDPARRRADPLHPHLAGHRLLGCRIRGPVHPHALLQVPDRLERTGWDLTTKDGALYVFPESFWANRGTQAALWSLGDRTGNRLTFTRDATTRNLTRITTPHGRWVEFTYDASHRITQAGDNIGRVVSYTYDASGRLWTVTDPAGGVTEYTYDATHRMVTLKDARGIVFLTNEYDGTGKMIRQTQADGTTYHFAYTLGAGGRVTQVDLTDPRGHIRRVTYGANGFMLTDTRALGTPIQQTTTYEREAGTNRLLAMIDPLGRRTAFGYDPMGNVTSLTRLAGTLQAVTTSFRYEPTFNQVASLTDPLNHTTGFGYDRLGNLTTITDPLDHQGRPSSLYELGDLVAVADPLGNTTRPRWRTIRPASPCP